VREIKHLSAHQWLRCAIPDSQQPSSPIGFLFLKLPPPPCAVLLVAIVNAYINSSDISNDFTIKLMLSADLSHDSHLIVIEGCLEVKLPTIWTDQNAEVGRVREEKGRRKKIREEKESEERRCRCAKR